MMARIVIVTGAASGIRLALASALAVRGDTVVVAGRDGDSAERAARQLARHGPGAATPAVVDVRDAAAVRALVEGTCDRYGRLDVLVNTAGVAVGGEAQELLLARWDRVIDVNLRGVVHGVHAAYPVMIAQRSWHIVNVASLAGLLPPPGLTPYAMTKHAVVGLSLSLRAEAAGYRVGVTAVCPAVVDTPMLDKGGPDDLPRPVLMRHGREIWRHYQPPFYPPGTAGSPVTSCTGSTAMPRWSSRPPPRGWPGGCGGTRQRRSPGGPHASWPGPAPRSLPSQPNRLTRARPSPGCPPVEVAALATTEPGSAITRPAVPSGRPARPGKAVNPGRWRPRLAPGGQAIGPKSAKLVQASTSRRASTRSPATPTAAAPCPNGPRTRPGPSLAATNGTSPTPPPASPPSAPTSCPRPRPVPTTWNWSASVHPTGLHDEPLALPRILLAGSGGRA
jgi:NAD(P)-dependent dehydrogenase (short-subunit alcohol dehydrogenase family)